MWPSGSRIPGSTRSCTARSAPDIRRRRSPAPARARAADRGRLVVPSDQAAAHVLVANLGVTLRQVILAEPDPELTAAVREGAIAAITGTAGESGDPVATVMELAAADPSALAEAETALLLSWLARLRARGSGAANGRQGDGPGVAR